MTVFFTCSHCNHEYIKDKTDEKLIQRFKKWYPKADLTSASLVCEKCYQIWIRMLAIEIERKNWINYAMNN